MHIREPQIAATEAIGEQFVIEAHEVQHGGPHVIDGAGVFDGVIAEVVGGTVDVARLDATTGHPDREAVRIVIATITALRKGRAAEFAGPDDEGAVEQAA